MHPSTRRDFETFLTAAVSYRRYIDNVTDELETERRRVQLKSSLELNSFLESRRYKVTQQNKLFIPRKGLEDFDGKVIINKYSAGFYSLIAYIKNRQPNVMMMECVKVRTDRGLCYICRGLDFNKIVKNKNSAAKDAVQGHKLGDNNEIIVKEHAVRRAIERSPIKDFESALSMILWSTFKGDLIEGQIGDILVPKGISSLSLEELERLEGLDMVEVMSLGTLSNAVYTSFGKLAGTRIALNIRPRTYHSILINTYLSDDMEP